MIYLIFDGIHYDILIRSYAEGLEESYDVTVFKLNDDYALGGA